MRLRLPRSLFARLFARLLGTAMLTTIAALGFAGVSIGHVLERFVIQGLDQQLDAQIGAVAAALRPDGTLDMARVIELPVFAEPGWGWQVDGPGGRHGARGVDLGPVLLDPPPPPEPSRDPHRAPHPDRRAGPPDAGPHAPRPGDARTPTGERVHYRQVTVPTAAGPVLVTASGPARIGLAPLREAMVPLLGSLALLAAGLAVATFVQLRWGLRPLRVLRVSVADVRAGRRRHVPVDQPDELAPLARELNALIDQNTAGLEHARRHVANLAHGLKTPLAALALKLAEEGRDPDGTLADLVARIDRHVRHHLGRARAAGAGSARMRTPIGPAIDDLCLVLDRLHAARAVRRTVAIPDDLAAAIDGQDFDEIAGNLLDNAWRHAASAIAIAADRVAGMTVLTIDDDGPGVPAAAIDDALRPGRRLDEQGDGHGFGLSIARELAELHGGSIALMRSPTLGGLRVSVTLPSGGG